MKWILLIGDENFNLNLIKAIEHPNSINCYDITEIKNRYCVDFGTDHIFYDYDEDGTILMEFEEDDLNKIPFINPHIIAMIYTSDERLKNVLEQDNYLKGIYVDNDYGLIVPIEDFIKLGMPIG